MLWNFMLCLFYANIPVSACTLFARFLIVVLSSVDPQSFHSPETILCSAIVIGRMTLSFLPMEHFVLSNRIPLAAARRVEKLIIASKSLVEVRISSSRAFAVRIISAKCFASEDSTLIYFDGTSRPKKNATDMDPSRVTDPEQEGNDTDLSNIATSDE